MTSLEWIYIKTNCLSRINRNLKAGHFQDLKTRSKDFAKNKIKIRMGTRLGKKTVSKPQRAKLTVASSKIRAKLNKKVTKINL